MMDCQNMGSKLSALMDHELSIEEEVKLREHLEKCQKCMLEFEEMRAVWNLMGQIPAIEPSADFWDTLHTKLVPQKESPFTRLNKVAQSIWDTLKDLFGVRLKPGKAHTFSLDVFNDFPPESFGQVLYPMFLDKVK